MPDETKRKRKRKRNPNKGFCLDRPKYKGHDGKTHESPKYHVRFKDHAGVWRRLVLFTDYEVSAMFGRKLHQVVNLRACGEPLDGDLAEWVDGLTDDHRDRLILWNVLDLKASMARTALSQHLDDWQQSILNDGSTSDHADEQRGRAGKLIHGCSFHRFADIDPLIAKGWIARNVKKHNTRNGYIGAIRQFCNWMVENGRATRSPVLKLKKVKVTDKTEKRALAIAQLQKLIETTRKSKDNSKMPGPERALLYLLACETGLRAAELRSLAVGNFDLACDHTTIPPKQPTVRVQAAYAKNSRTDTLTLSVDLARCLRRHFAKKLPAAAAFNMPKKTAVMVRRDLERAGIPAVDATGGVFNFHALRTQTATDLARGGAHPAVAQRRLRHATVQLTLDVYTKLGLDEHQDAALKALPKLATGA